MLLIRGGTLYLGKGRYQKGQDILIQDGLISAIAPGISQADCTTIDAEGMTVFPGFILPVSSIGAYGFFERVKDNSETTDPVTPHLDILYSFDIRELNLQHLSRAGITSYGLSPGDSTLLSGSMALLHSYGQRSSDLVILPKIAVKGNFTQTVKSTFGEGLRMPYSRMAMFYMLDDALRQAREYMESKEGTDKAIDYDAKAEALIPILKRELPLVMNAYIQREIEAIAELAVKYNIRTVIHGAYQIDRCATKVIDAGCHVALGDLFFYQYALNFETDIPKIIELYRQGLQLSLASCSDNPSLAGYEQIYWSAALLQRYGATPDEVLDMLTLNPAKALGVEHLVGSLEVGKQADMILSLGNPLELFDTAPLYTIVTGEVAYHKGGIQDAAH